MGAWGIGIFDNDSTLDWVFDLEESEDLSVIENAINMIVDRGDEYIDADLGDMALGAIATAALILKKQPESIRYPEEVLKWVNEHPLDVADKLIKNCQKAIEEILDTNSELRDLWEETDEYDKWKAMLVELQECFDK